MGDMMVACDIKTKLINTRGYKYYRVYVREFGQYELVSTISYIKGESVTHLDVRAFESIVHSQF